LSCWRRSALVATVGYALLGAFVGNRWFRWESPYGEEGKRMPEDEHKSPLEPLPRKKGKPWFRRNQPGPGWHPSSWPGGLILGVIVAAIVVVVLFRTGLL
jgi:hypothetical protein